MKKIGILLAVVVAGFLAYQYFVAGDGGFGMSSTSGIERQLDDLEHRFDAARKQAAGAGRGAAIAGIDTTADVEAARAEVDRILDDIAKLRKRADDSIRSEVERLERSVRAFRDEID